MVKQPKHFVFIRQLPPIIVWGGLERLMVDWCEHIDLTRCRVTLLVSQGGAPSHIDHLAQRNLPIEVVEFPFRTNFAYTQPFLERFWRTFNLLKSMKADEAVFFQGSYFDFDLSHVMAAALATGGRAYMHENLGAPLRTVQASRLHFGFIPGMGLWRTWERLSTSWRPYFCREVMAVSQELKLRLMNLWGYPEQKVTVQYHGVKVQEFCPSSETNLRMRKTLNLDLSDQIIIVSSRLAQEKCIDRAILAFQRLAVEFPKLRLVIAGTGPLESKLKELAASHEHSDRIHFLGYVKNISDYLKMGDIYLLPSNNEGLSISCLEALATGLICVATNSPGLTEALDQGRIGFLVERHTDAVYEGLRQALTLSEAERQELSQQAVQYIHDHFQISKNVCKTLKHLDIPSRP